MPPDPVDGGVTDSDTPNLGVRQPDQQLFGGRQRIAGQLVLPALNVNGDDLIRVLSFDQQPDPALLLRLGRVFEVQLSLDLLGACFGDWLLVRFSLWQDKVPMDALPHEGAIRIRVMTESELVAQFSGEHWSA